MAQAEPRRPCSVTGINLPEGPNDFISLGSFSAAKGRDLLWGPASSPGTAEVAASLLLSKEETAVPW